MATTTSSIKNRPQPFPLASWAPAIVLTIIGLAAWVYQLSAGMSVTGYNQEMVWGLYIAAFFSLAAAGAGLLFLAGLSEFQPIVALAHRGRLLMMAIGSFVAAAVLILMDIGNPINAWRLITAFRFNVPMTWDFWLLLVSGVIALVYLLSNGKQSRLLGGLGMASALALVIVEGILLASNAARPLWGGMTVAGFLAGAVVAGLSLALLVLPRQESPRLLSALGWALGITLALVLAEVLAGLVSANQRTSATLREILSGTASPFFWFHLVAGLLAPLALIKYASASWKVPAAAGLALLGVLAEKCWLLVAEQAHSWVGLPAGSYFPSWVEFLAALGACALGALIFQALAAFVAPKPD